MACSDTGSTSLLVRQSDASGIALTSTIEPISVALPNGTTIRATSCGFIFFNNSYFSFIFFSAYTHSSLHLSRRSLAYWRIMQCRLCGNIYSHPLRHYIQRSYCSEGSQTPHSKIVVRRATCTCHSETHCSRTSAMQCISPQLRCSLRVICPCFPWQPGLFYLHSCYSIRLSFLVAANHSRFSSRSSTTHNGYCERSPKPAPTRRRFHQIVNSLNSSGRRCRCQL